MPNALPSHPPSELWSHHPPLRLRSWRGLRGLLLVSLAGGALGLSSCWVGEPFSEQPMDAGVTSPTSSASSGPSAAPDPRVPGPPAPRPTPEAEPLGFSTTQDGRLVAFAAQTGAIHAELPLGNEILDLQWLPRACRLMARVRGQAASQRIFSFKVRRTSQQRLEFSLEGASEELWGPTQILGVGGGALQASGRPGVEALWLSSGEPAPSWQRLDSALNPLSGQAAWPAPRAWHALPGGSVIALLGSGEDSEIALATLNAGAPQIERRPWPHAEALTAEGGQAWVWRTLAGAATIQILDLPAFKLSGEIGHFPSGAPRALVASASRLAAYQVELDGTVRILLQANGVTRTRRFVGAASAAERPLALQGDYLWFASDSAVCRVHLPMLSASRSFYGAELRAPLVVPPAKTLGCIR